MTIDGRFIMVELRGSQTEKNLLAAFAGESQARTRYTFFASVAKKEGYEQIGYVANMGYLASQKKGEGL
jgi:rubrerythrin